MITLDNVSFHYATDLGAGEGVDDVDLTIPDGEFVVLCGRSGCGKTTLTRLINGLAPHFFEGVTLGEVRIDDFCVTTAELSQVSAHVGSVFQNPKSQFFNIDTTGELAFGCENLGLERAEITRRLDKTVADFNLDALIGRNIFELSGGEKQQIACGSVYAAEPAVYVLDEPSSNLDKRAIGRLRQALARVKASGRTVVITEHRLHYLMDLADRFVYLDHGRVEQVFTTAEMRALSDDDLAELGLRCTDLTQVSFHGPRPAMAEGAAHDSVANGPLTTDGVTTDSVTHDPVADGGVDTDSAGHDSVDDGGVANNHVAKDGAPGAGRSRTGVAIEGVDLSCNRGSAQILDIESLQLPAGSVVALIGENGCGKSTLAEALCGVGSAGGSIAFSGTFMSDRQRAKNCYMVMQDVNHQLFSDSVIEELMLNATATEERAAEILEQLDLTQYADRHPASLSGGQKQRVAIASALCAGKRILFYDEPTSGLDRAGMERFGQLLSQVSDQTDISVVITHDLELVLRCCTHVLHLENGRASGLYPLDAEGVARTRYYFGSPSSQAVSRRRASVGPFTRILRYAGRHKKFTYLAVAVMILAVVAKMAPYLVVYGVLSRLIAGQGLTFADGARAVGAVFAFEALHAVLYAVGLALSHHAAYHTLENIRCSLSDKMDAQPVGHVKSMGAGAVKKLLSDDVELLEVLLAHMIPEGLANLIVPTAGLLIMLAVDWQLALLTAVMIYFGYLASKEMFVTGMDRMGKYYASTKRLNNAIIEYVNGMEVVKVFNRDGEAGQKLRHMVVSYRDYALDWYKACWPWMAGYSSIFSSVVLYSLPLGAMLILLGQLTVAEFALVLCLSFGLGPMLVHCLSFMSAVPNVNFRIQALEKALDRPPLQVAEAGFSGANHDVALADVRFAYGDDEVLKGVSFTARAGSMCAIVGESGSGKSTVGRLLAHHYDVSAGQITIGGQDVRDMSLAALNDQVSYVAQELFLFNVSISENIRLGRPSATDADVRQAAAQAQCLDFIEALPHGFDTLAGDAGNKLSGGERQRITFARAILKDAPIIVLDEATAFIDPENEEKMVHAIRRTIAGKTVIVIAHRLRTIAGAGQIVVLDKGKVADVGTHAELLARCDRYQKLWQNSTNGAGWGVVAPDPAGELAQGGAAS